jgi:hypothetical protein
MIISVDAAIVGAELTAVALYAGRKLWQVGEILLCVPVNKWADLDR